jgi:membrane protein implicated in regulation of membrane protease activity
VVLPLIVFVVVSLLASMVALLLFDGVAWPVVIGVFSGFAAATVLNATDVLARRSSRGGEGSVGGRDDERENDRVR